MRPLLLLLISILSAPAFAVVDMKTANFADTWTDLVAPGSGYDLRIQRTYNSRTIYSGIFGFGWCSDFETRTEVTPEGNLKVVECGAGSEITYTPKKFDGKKVDQTISSIMSEVKKRNKGMSDKSATEMQRDLKEDDFFREEFARRIGIKGAAAKDTVYYANGRENESIVRQTDNFKRSLADGSFQLFDSAGRLTHIYDRNGNSLKMTYDKDLLTGVIDNNGRRLTLTYSGGNKKVKKITGPNNLSAEYTTKGEDLVEVLNSWKKKYRYTYDDVHNLTKIDLPDGTHKGLTYNKDKDWVTSFQNQKGCVENYEYTVNSEDPKNHFSSTVSKKCGDKITNQSKYEFFHRQRADGTGIYLYRVKSDNNGILTDITYHEIFGKPVAAVRGGMRTDYTYYDNGFLKSKKEPGRILAYEYKNTCSKPSRVEIDYNDPTPAKNKDKEKDKAAAPTQGRKVATTFSYEAKKCALIYAENTDGQTVKLEYDVRGRIAQIEDQSKKIVKIKYEEKFGKPEIVSRPGLGTIKVVYKPDGEIGNVESKDGPRVAVQVASIFSNLLEIIAPASAETNL